MPESGDSYDYMILGGGIGGLVCGALLARAGARVLLVERHDTLGGYAHSFRKQGFEFCYQVQYLMGCEPGGPIRRLLERLGIADEVAFNFLDPDGYDVIVCDELEFRIPSTTAAFCRALQERYPGSAGSIARYFRRVEAIFEQAEGYRRTIRPRDVVLSPWRRRELIRHMGKTVDDVFDALELPQELRFILAGQAGNLAVGPREASFLLQAAMQVAYGRSAAYPQRGLGHMIAAIARCLEQAPGCRVLRGVEVQAIHRAGRRRIGAVTTTAGRFSARHYISNLDPQRTYALIEPRDAAGPRYRYSDAVFTLYLGFEALDLRAHGFGRHNYWIHSRQDIDREFADVIQRHDHRQPWIFLSTPSLLAEPGTICAREDSSMVMLTFVSYAHWSGLAARDPSAYRRLGDQLEGRFLEVLRSRFGVPLERLRVRHRETPLTVVERLDPPQGNVYGARLTPASYNMRRTTSRTRYANLELVGATSAYPGVMPISVASMALCDRLLARG